MKAFPNYEWNETYKQMMPTGGMDLRDYFAAKAMQSLLTHDYIYLYDKAVTQSYENVEDYVVETAYFIADEMMKAREK